MELPDPQEPAILTTAPLARSAARGTSGDRRRIGLWILPHFLVTALIGAALAGGLAALYYEQRVGQLEDATSSARGQILGTRDQVLEAAQESRDEIARLVAEAQDDLASSTPLDVPADGGVYAVSAAHAAARCASAARSPSTPMPSTCRSP